MAILHQYDYIFAIGTIFAALDAYNIGANDVSNSFATSVSSRSLTMRQACVLAALCEFLGAVLVGSKVSGTIKNGIISLSVFQGNPGVEMLAFTCALVSSASWLMFCTHNSLTVSTTYSIVSALAGVGVATGGGGAVQWGWNGGKGLATIWSGFIIAPAIAGGFGSVVYLITKYAVLERKNSLKCGLFMAPMYFFTVIAVLTMSIVYKGAPNLKLNKLPEVTIALAIVLTALVAAVLCIVFWIPYVYCKVVRKDYTLRWWHMALGPLLWKRPAPDPRVDGSHVPDYRVYGRDDAVPEKGPRVETVEAGQTGVTGRTDSLSSSEGKEMPVDGHQPATLPQREVPLEEVEEDDSKKIIGDWYLPRNLKVIFLYKIPKALLYGSSVDVVSIQRGNDKHAQRIDEMHARTVQYDNETEHMYSFLQVLTACTNSFGHGANDVSNAIGPYAAIYHVWSTSTASKKDTPTPTWMLAFGGAMIVIGLATYGWKIMRVLGNRLTMHSPSRGFSMEMGSSITVLLATQYGIPVSTTMCITGATIGVGICSGGFKALNWRAYGRIFLGWVATVPIAGLLGGITMGVILNAPHFNS